MINVSYTIIGESTCASEPGNYLLAIVQCPETGEIIQAALKELIDEVNSLTSVTVDGKEVIVEVFIGGDLKFLNQVTGIGGFASIHSCLWCKCSKQDRSDVSLEWSMTDVTKGARMVDEITENSGKPKSSKSRYNCNTPPIFHSVPISRVVPDTLHLFLRIMDQLVYQLVYYLQTCDNIVRLSLNLDLQKCDNLMRFENFVASLGIYDWKLVIKDSKLQPRSFTGPEHRRILANIDLDMLIPTNPKLEQIKTLWSSFKSLIGQLNCVLSDDNIDQFDSSAKAWVDLSLLKTFPSKCAENMLSLRFTQALCRTVWGLCRDRVAPSNELVGATIVYKWGWEALRQLHTKEIRQLTFTLYIETQNRILIYCSFFVIVEKT